ncbi:hypothetical protein LBA_00003 [Megavirus lba]|uniref:Uncharacterized protein n=2 Tax=Megamimivirinae TaxID=3044648 RepID=A0A2L2DL69_MIMIV|nr:hypothetical protein LBA_00003 [Megavirus lba]AVG46877.1 hypothetical protein [Acanthamoeba polyphaga mimivirus]
MYLIINYETSLYYNQNCILGILFNKKLKIKWTNNLIC